MENNYHLLVRYDYNGISLVGLLFFNMMIVMMSIKMVLQKGWAGVQGYVTAPGHYSSDHPVIRSSLNFFHFPMPPGG